MFRNLFVHDSRIRFHKEVSFWIQNYWQFRYEISSLNEHTYDILLESSFGETKVATPITMTTSIKVYNELTDGFNDLSNKYNGISNAWQKKRNIWLRKQNKQKKMSKSKAIKISNFITKM